ncbi:MATE efflux family protein [Cenococcum geophilum 1.58]|uniref:MATE efflux family protein n=1 Tax=Cenococcum geophilum 1.58 TaxID=794803 RepID=UPI00358FCD07|nr:MATE efflux family protein [Cenococcum geophilum 1.58]
MARPRAGSQSDCRTTDIRVLSPTALHGESSWRHESTTLARTSWPLILAFLLQYSLPVASVFTVGHLGKIELGAVSLAGMTANITGYAVYRGLATALDTLCAQAYGSGHKTLVGLHMQRMVCLLWMVTIPVGLIWFSSPWILSMIVPEKETARMAGLYLRILLLGAPGWSAFEVGKRFVQAQGIFTAQLCILLVLAPLNGFLHWLFVWHFKWGFVGAPIAVAVTNTLLPLSLIAYNWGPMISLALPGLLMVEAEWLAFEILTLSSSFLGPDVLAAQSIVITLATLASQVPTPLSIAASTRVANLIGAELASQARLAAKVALAGGVCVGAFNAAVFASLRNYIPRLFTNDEDVARLVATLLPLCTMFQMLDALATGCNALLRGIGRQEVGGYVCLGCFYIVGLPISYVLAFVAHWDLFGLWAGPSLALGLVAAIEACFLFTTGWDQAVEEAKTRIPLLQNGY